MNYIRQVLYDRWHRTKKLGLVEKLVDDLAEKMVTFADLEVFVVTCERVLLTINESLSVIPNDDKIFAYSYATALLQTKGERGLAEIINLWDDLGIQGCLAAERAEVVK